MMSLVVRYPSYGPWYYQNQRVVSSYDPKCSVCKEPLTLGPRGHKGTTALEGHFFESNVGKVAHFFHEQCIKNHQANQNYGLLCPSADCHQFLVSDETIVIPFQSVDDLTDALGLSFEETIGASIPGIWRDECPHCLESLKNGTVLWGHIAKTVEKTAHIFHACCLYDVLKNFESKCSACLLPLKWQNLPLPVSEPIAPPILEPIEPPVSEPIAPLVSAPIDDDTFGNLIDEVARASMLTIEQFLSFDFVSGILASATVSLLGGAVTVLILASEGAALTVIWQTVAIVVTSMFFTIIGAAVVLGALFILANVACDIGYWAFRQVREMIRNTSLISLI